MRLALVANHSLLTAITVAAASTAHAQIASDDFESGNPNLWGVEFTMPGAQMSTGGNPGGRLALTVESASSNLMSAMIVPASPNHPFRGNLRALGAAEFRFDRQVEQGSSNFGTLPFLVLGNDGGTPNDFADDAWLFAPTGDSFQFGFVPYETIATAIPFDSMTVPALWDLIALPGHPLAGMAPSTIWNAVIEDVSYVGISMSRPFNGGPWFGIHDLSLDNMVLDFGSNVGLNFCGPANTNSAGLQGQISLLGNPVAAQNSLKMNAQFLPNSAFGFFIAGPTQGFVMNPGGSEGNLCLSGAIGRYVGPGQIQNTGATGTMSLPIDLTNVPTPSGFTALTAGQTWNFQAWHRDISPAGATSNFTDAVSITLL